MSKNEFEFDKFMNDIVKRESKAQNVITPNDESYTDNPRREQIQRYQERWQNRITWSAHKEKKDG